MSYPFYYPYFSARNAYHPPLLQMDLPGASQSQLKVEQSEIELAVRRRQQIINQQRIYRYQQELKSKQRALQLLDQAEIQNKLQVGMREQVYHKRLDDLRYQDHLRNIGRLQKEGNGLSKEADSMGKKQLKVSAYNQDVENERKVQQYQQQLLDKIQACSSHKKERSSLNKSSPEVSKAQKSNKASKGKKLSYADSEVQGDDNIIINKRDVKQLSVKKISSKTNKRRSINYEHLKKPKIIEDIDLEDYQTIDVDSLAKKNHLWMNQSTKKKQNYSIYQSQHKGTHKHKRPRSSLPGHSIAEQSRRSIAKKSQKKKLSFLSSDRAQAPQEALKKIQNRLKLSEIVYKDSKWRHSKHEAEHLINTFEREMKGRKQIKDNINNHPQILKKHALVVGSR